MKTIISKDAVIKTITKDLIESPTIIQVNKFTEEASRDLSKGFSEAHNTGQPIIPVKIDSYGGQAYSLLAMIAEFESSKLPIATVAIGKAMSCGAILLGLGSVGHRYIDPNATIMVHDVATMAWGKTEDLKASVKEVERLSKFLYQKLAAHCGHKDKDYFLKIIGNKKNADWFLSAQEAKKHRLIDHIGVPNFKVQISAKIDFGL